MKKVSLRVLFCLVALSIGPASGQQSTPVSPPPRPTEEPSLELTMKFIQLKLTEYGTVSWALRVRDEEADTWTVQHKLELSDVVADSVACRVDYRWNLWSNGWVTGTPSSSRDNSVDLRNLQDVTVGLVEQDGIQITRNPNDPNWEYVSVPAVFAVMVRSAKGGPNSFDFLDEGVASSVAKAIVRAAELCGAGK